MAEPVYGLKEGGGACLPTGCVGRGCPPSATPAPARAAPGAWPRACQRLQSAARNERTRRRNRGERARTRNGGIEHSNSFPSETVSLRRHVRTRGMWVEGTWAETLRTETALIFDRPFRSAANRELPGTDTSKAA